MIIYLKLTEQRYEKVIDSLNGTTMANRYEGAIYKEDKDNRDLLIYLLWSTGWYNNHKIGELFGIGYSSISRRVAIMKVNLLKDADLKMKFKK